MCWQSQAEPTTNLVLKHSIMERDVIIKKGKCMQIDTGHFLKSIKVCVANKDNVYFLEIGHR